MHGYNRQHVISGSGDGVIRMWRLKDGSLERELTGHENHVSSLAVSAPGSQDGEQYLVSGGWDETVRVWRLSDGQSIRILRGHRQHVPRRRHRTISAGRTVHTLRRGFDDTIRVWNAPWQ